MEESIKEKNGFFKRLKTAIFRVENYGDFLGEKPYSAIKYFLTLILFVVVIISLVSTYYYYKEITKGISYIKNELPDFTLTDGILKFDEYVEGYDSEYDFSLIINTFDISDAEVENYAKKIQQATIGVILLKDRFILNVGPEMNLLSENYTNLSSAYNISISNKSDLINLFSNSGVFSFCASLFAASILMYYITYGISVFSDLCFVALVGILIARLCGIRLKIAGAFDLSVYSLTLSILLSCVYNCSKILFGFTMEYFAVFYLLLAYVYLIAALFIIKDDLIKQQQELEKIYEVQEEVKKELENSNTEVPEEEKKEEKKQDENEDNTNDTDDNKEEPNNEDTELDGSEI